ncbi:hypothetical protein BV22DRAFT_1013797 [Leucogyrophana mollusca]|uniref:Uncharacterized protein n=1 Tax=Leucogyrophana mollusca TaxID=85980 RepID=A0ACB8BFA5_9AGAM|nr:hypothetical protein BV22DRAFT_1013797 [Leucogyrophana mollusca]
MSKSDFYLSRCIEAASKASLRQISSMTYNLGAVLVKGGKVISTGYNHHRTHYDGNDIRKHGHRKPVSMHAEMHAIYNLTGMSPSFKQQVQVRGRRTAAAKRRPWHLGATTNSSCEHGGGVSDGEKALGARRRDPRVNGGDIYVVRVVKNGLGSARPCWRCVRWCHWSGVKRIFHWNSVERRFDVIKVNSLDNEFYETQADARLFAGSVCRRS